MPTEWNIGKFDRRTGPLPPITMPEPTGMSAYPGKPVVEDQAGRGTLTGTRNDSVTFVCERAGEFLFPAVTIPWWDTDANELKKIRLAGVTVTVSEAPGNAKQADVTSASEPSSPGGLPRCGRWMNSAKRLRPV